MSPSPDSVADPANLSTYLHHRHRNAKTTTKIQDTTQSRGRNTSRNELGRRDKQGGRVTRIYPREMSPPTSKRYSSGSPTGPAYNATTSPLLSALGATKTAAQYTNEWTKSLPFFANQASPVNGGIAINGSPEGLYAPAGMSNSPPAPGMRPLSHPNHYTSFGGRLQGSPQDSPARDRRASLYSQPAGHPASRHFANNPPLPHQPQAHFYGLPDLNDFGLSNTPTEGITQTAGEGGYFCGFDTLGMAGDEAARSAENVLLVGCQGGIDVFRVEKSKMDIVGRLEGLRGAVIGAKILPCISRYDPIAELRPLIALTIHGPVVSDSRSSNSGSPAPSVVDDSSSDSPSRPPSRGGNASAGQVLNYQTTVEVYSLKAKQRIAVLYQSPLIPLTTSFKSPLFQPPPPVGEFVVDAKGKFVVVASGSSGEVFIFAPYAEDYVEYPEKFRCIGKLWTTVQFRERVLPSTSSSAADGSHEDVAPEEYGVPIFSLSERWLAVTPPASTALRSLNGVALLSPYYERPPGLAHHTVPPQPLPNCAVDEPEAESLVNRLTREGTQVALKWGGWATEKGLQAFKSYMNKNPQGNGGANNVTYGVEPAQHYFPPTHGHNQAQPRQESSVVSIYDLQRLHDAEESKNKSALHAIATIPAAHGCSFLSFSPSGLMLMTVSRKGDSQDVWDLKRMNSRRARKASREQPSGPHVRQIARFSRMTVTNVVDAVWSTPRIDRVAVITDKGTVHMFLMPASAFQWPPPRRIRKPAEVPRSREDVPGVGRGNPINNAMQAINGKAMPFLNSMRSSGTNSGSRFTLSSLGMTPAAGAKSGKAVAAGVGQSINNIRHAGDNKITLPASLSGVKPNSVRWLTGKGRGQIAMVGGGALQIYRIQMRAATGKGKSANATSILKTKLAEFGLAPIYDARCAPSIDAQLQSLPEGQDVEHGIYGEWVPRLLPSRRARTGPSPAPLSFSEIETNPPYQPFYTDRRVARFVFSRVGGDMQTSNVDQEAHIPELASNLHHKDNASPWVFGQDYEAIRVLSPATQHYDSGDEDFATRFENRLVLQDGEEDAGKVVSTTRRRRVRKEGTEEDEDGFFEDDCEVLDFAEDRV